MMESNKLAEAIRFHISSERDRYILYRHLVDGATYEQIADEMGDNPDNAPTADSIGKRCRRAMAALQPYIVQ